MPFALLVGMAAVYVAWSGLRQCRRREKGSGQPYAPDVDLSSFAVRGAAERLLGQTPEWSDTAGAARFANGAGSELALGPVLPNVKLADETESHLKRGDAPNQQPEYTTDFAGLLLDLRPLVRTTQALLLFSCERVRSRVRVLMHAAQAHRFCKWPCGS